MAQGIAARLYPPGQTFRPCTPLGILAVSSDLLFSGHDDERPIHRPVLLSPLGKTRAGYFGEHLLRCSMPPSIHGKAGAGHDDAHQNRRSPPRSPLGKARGDPDDPHLRPHALPTSPLGKAGAFSFLFEAFGGCVRAMKPSPQTSRW